VIPPFHVEWLRALKSVFQEGRPSAPRGRGVLELLGRAVRFDGNRALLVHPTRKLNYRFAVAEWLWIAAGRGDLTPLVRYNPRMAEFSDDGTRLAGAYGPRLAHQWGYVLDKLREDPDSRQAVAQIWTANPGRSKDVPCTMAAQFLLRGGRLHSIWTMRSSDLWLGLPYDAFSFSRLAASVAGCLGVPQGFVEIAAGSSHLYDVDFSLARQVLAEEEAAYSVHLEELDGFPPYGAHALLDVGVRRPADGALAAEWFRAPWQAYGLALESRGSLEALGHLLRAPAERDEAA